MKTHLVLLLILLCLIPWIVSASQVAFTTSDTWTVPAGITSITCDIVGAGGGGKGGGGSYYDDGYPGYGGIGGSAGQIKTGQTITTTPGETLTITVGTGGTGGNGGDEGTYHCSGANGSTGGATSIAAQSGTTTSTGGSGATTCNGSSKTGTSGANGYGSGTYATAGQTASGGYGGQGGAAGTGYGAGGGGGGGADYQYGSYAGGKGGNGASGYVVITYTTGGSAPVAAFSANTTSGYYPLVVAFTDASTNTPSSWCWDVDNDGDCDYTTQHVTHTYSSAGTFTVNLTVSNAYGSDSEKKTNYITTSEEPTPTPTPTTTFTSTPTATPDYSEWPFIRPTASTTMAILDNSSYETLVGIFGGEEIMEHSGSYLNWTDILDVDLFPFENTLGLHVALLIIFSIPFLMQWLMQANSIIPAVSGIILGAFILAYLPSEYYMVAVAFISLSILAVLYSLLKERM